MTDVLTSDTKVTIYIAGSGSGPVEIPVKEEVARERPSYVPCKGNNFGKHKFERLKHNQFEKCMLCGEPRFALVDQSLSRENGPLCRALNETLP